MKKLEEMSTAGEVDEHISQIVRNMPPGFKELAKSGSVTEAERKENPKLDALCRAFERRQELEQRAVC